MDELLKGMLNSPLAMAAVQKVLVDFIKKYLKGLDSQHFSDNIDKYAHLAIVVLSGLSAFLKLVVDHQASTFDPTPLVQYALTLYTATVSAHEVSKLVVKKDAPKQ